MIGVLDYGLGNVSAFLNAFRDIGIKACRVSNPETSENLKSIILPGVGSYDWALKQLKKTGLNKLLLKKANEGMPLLGVCVGMQLLGHNSQEGVSDGLGLIEGNVKRFPSDALRPVPHMGWNNIVPEHKSHPLFVNISAQDDFYFLHSYYFHGASQNNTIASSFYINQFSSVIQKGNVFGCQFHPEKSHTSGLQLLSNFAKIDKC